MAEIGQDIAKAKYILENGGLVAVPTETVNGFGSKWLNAKAVAKGFEAKGAFFSIHTYPSYE